MFCDTHKKYRNEEFIIRQIGSCGLIGTNFRKVKMSDLPDFYNQAFNSRTAVFDN